jgi:hypothetical protein
MADKILVLPSRLAMVGVSVGIVVGVLLSLGKKAYIH